MSTIDEEVAKLMEEAKHPFFFESITTKQEERLVQGEPELFMIVMLRFVNKNGYPYCHAMQMLDSDFTLAAAQDAVKKLLFWIDNKLTRAGYMKATTVDQLRRQLEGAK